MKLYIASSSQSKARQLSRQLEAAGYECTSSWVQKDEKFDLGLSAYTDYERRSLALRDEEDVRNAVDGVILIAESPGRFVPGGKHVETGMAIALGRSVYVLGQKENVFHWHPLVKVFRTEGELVAHLESQLHSESLSRCQGP
jgi:hypothetical protein